LQTRLWGDKEDLDPRKYSSGNTERTTKTGVECFLSWLRRKQQDERAFKEFLLTLEGRVALAGFMGLWCLQVGANAQPCERVVACPCPSSASRAVRA
jgi:hypothetical protein